MLNIEVVWMDAQGQVQERSLQLPAGACLQDAITACGLELSVQQSCGVWGRVKPLEYALQALKVDPKVARRERFAQQGARGAGLFAKRRANSKSGY